MSKNKTIAVVMDLEGIARGPRNSQKRKKFYEYLESKELLVKQGWMKNPTQKSLDEGHAKVVAKTAPYVEWNADFIFAVAGENRFCVGMSEVHDTYYSATQLCNDRYMSEPFSRGEIKILLAPSLDDDGKSPTQEAIDSGDAKWQQGFDITEWDGEQLKKLYDEFQKTKGD